MDKQHDIVPIFPNKDDSTDHLILNLKIKGIEANFYAGANYALVNNIIDKLVDNHD